MKQKRTFITLLLIIALLCLGIAYAAITSQNLKVTGSVEATTSDNNFDVKFTGTPTTDGAGNVEATIDTTADSTGRTATIKVTGLTTAEQTATATYTITNASPADLSANLTSNVAHDNDAWFEVTQDLADTSIDKGDSTTITLTVKLLKTPATADDLAQAKDSITLTIGAEAVQPTV